jgi:hypothetical protein
MDCVWEGREQVAVGSKPDTAFNTSLAPARISVRNYHHEGDESALGRGMAAKFS